MYIFDSLSIKLVSVSHPANVRYGLTKIDGFDRKLLMVETINLWAGSSFNISIRLDREYRINKIYYLIKDVKPEVKLMPINLLLPSRNQFSSIDTSVDVTSINVLTIAGKRMIGTEPKYYQFVLDGQPIL
jgi:hypothetical protein